MTPFPANSCGNPWMASVTNRLASLGLPYALIDSAGEVSITGPISCLHASPEAPTALSWLIRDQAAHLAESNEVIELCDGLWIYRLMDRRLSGIDRSPTIAAIFFGEAFFASEVWQSICDARRIDPASARREMSDGLIGTAAQAAQTARLVGCIAEDTGQLARSQAEIGGVAQELADSYEELSLLYKLSCSMTLNAPRIGFLSESCMELQQVLGIEWLAIHINDAEAQLSDLRGKTFTAGHARGDRQAVPTLGRALINHHPFSDQPHVIDDVDELNIPAVGAIARNLLVVPLQIERKRLGVLYGGNKLDGSALTSVDAKLCSSLANSVTIYLQNSALYEDMESMFMGTLKALTSAIDAKDSYTFGHTERVAMLSRQLAEACGIDEAEVERIYLSGLLHDVGKIGVPESVLTKPGALTDEEFALIKMHPEIGARILGDIRQMRDLIPGVLYHHERWDGRGYPAGLRGDDIPLFGRVICVADSFDAMSSNRTYRQAMPHSKVMSQIRECAGSQFDPALADAFCGLDFSPYLEMADRHRSQSTRRCA